MKRMSVLLALGLVCAIAACQPTTPPAAGPSPSTAPHNTDAAEQAACTRLQKGPAVAVTATLDEARAPEVQADRRRYDVTLVPTGTNPGGTGGFVKFIVPRAVEWSFFLSKDVLLMARDASGLPMTVVEKDPKSNFCAEVKAQYIHLFDVGPVTVEFGPTNETSLGFVIEETHPTANN